MWSCGQGGHFWDNVVLEQRSSELQMLQVLLPGRQGQAPQLLPGNHRIISRRVLVSIRCHDTSYVQEGGVQDDTQSVIKGKHTRNSIHIQGIQHFFCQIGLLWLERTAGTHRSSSGEGGGKDLSRWQHHASGQASLCLRGLRRDHRRRQ